MKKRFKRPPRRLAEQFAYIRGHFCEPISVSELARGAGVSSVQFIAMFRRFYGVSPKNYITMRRLNLAKLLLSLSEYPAFHIANVCGYTNEFYFYRLFRRRFGMTPTAYREKNKKAHSKARESKGETECLK